MCLSFIFKFISIFTLKDQWVIWTCCYKSLNNWEFEWHNIENKYWQGCTTSVWTTRAPFVLTYTDMFIHGHPPLEYRKYRTSTLISCSAVEAINHVAPPRSMFLLTMPYPDLCLWYCSNIVLITNLQHNSHVVIHNNTFLQCGLFWPAWSKNVDYVVHISGPPSVNQNDMNRDSYGHK